MKRRDVLLTWEYEVEAGEGMLDSPSLAQELPGTGDIIVADNQQDRVDVDVFRDWKGARRPRP